MAEPGLSACGPLAWTSPGHSQAALRRREVFFCKIHPYYTTVANRGGLDREAIFLDLLDSLSPMRPSSRAGGDGRSRLEHQDGFQPPSPARPLAVWRGRHTRSGRSS